MMLWIFLSTVIGHSYCHSLTPPKSILFSVNQTLSKRSLTVAPTTKNIVPVYWHVVHHNELHKLTPDTVFHQINQMNKAYNGSTLYFQLAGINYINDKNLVHLECCETPEEKLLKSTHRKFGKETLNIYSADSGYHNKVGTVWQSKKSSVSWSTFPDSELSMDGLVISTDRLSYNEKLPTTLIHESGHFFGLLHTFRGGCDDPNNDYVSDTSPADESSRSSKNGQNAVSWTWQCNVPQKTCINSPGDVITSFMDYTDCRQSFTPGQHTRIEYFRFNYRNSQKTCQFGSSANPCWPLIANFASHVTGYFNKLI